MLLHQLFGIYFGNVAAKVAKGNSTRHPDRTRQDKRENMAKKGFAALVVDKVIYHWRLDWQQTTNCEADWLNRCNFGDANRNRTYILYYYWWLWIKQWSPVYHCTFLVGPHCVEACQAGQCDQSNRGWDEGGLRATPGGKHPHFCSAPLHKKYVMFIVPKLWCLEIVQSEVFYVSGISTTRSSWDTFQSVFSCTTQPILKR